MNGFQTITNVRKRTADDNAHRVIEVRAAHFLFNRDRRNVGRQRLGNVGIRQGEPPEKAAKKENQTGTKPRRES